MTTICFHNPHLFVLDCLSCHALLRTCILPCALYTPVFSSKDSTITGLWPRPAVNGVFNCNASETSFSWQSHIIGQGAKEPLSYCLNGQHFMQWLSFFKSTFSPSWAQIQRKMSKCWSTQNHWFSQRVNSCEDLLISTSGCKNKCLMHNYSVIIKRPSCFHWWNTSWISGSLAHEKMVSLLQGS